MGQQAARAPPGWWRTADGQGRGSGVKPREVSMVVSCGHEFGSGSCW